MYNGNHHAISCSISTFWVSCWLRTRLEEKINVNIYNVIDHHHHTKYWNTDLISVVVSNSINLYISISTLPSHTLWELFHGNKYVTRVVLNKQAHGMPRIWIFLGLVVPTIIKRNKFSKILNLKYNKFYLLTVSNKATKSY